MLTKPPDDSERGVPLRRGHTDKAQGGTRSRWPRVRFLLGVALASALGVADVSAQYIEPFTNILGSAILASADPRVYFEVTLSGYTWYISKPPPNRFMEGTAYTTWGLFALRPADQVLVSSDPQQLFLLDAGAQIGPVPPEGAFWTNTLAAAAFYSNVVEVYPPPRPDRVPPATLLEQGGTWLDRTNSLAAGRYLAADGWHYGWMSLAWRGWFVGVSEPSLSGYGFHPLANAPVWAGEPPLPRLQARLASAGVTLAWTSHDGSYVLEETGQLPAASWTTIRGVTTDGVQHEVTLPRAERPRFFRLRKSL